MARQKTDPAGTSARHKRDSVSIREKVSELMLFENPNGPKASAKRIIKTPSHL